MNCRVEKVLKEKLKITRPFFNINLIKLFNIISLKLLGYIVN